jgi:hypothetical protein
MNSPMPPLAPAESGNDRQAPGSTGSGAFRGEAIAESGQAPSRPKGLLMFTAAAAAILLAGIGIVVVWALNADPFGAAPPFVAAKQKCASSSEYAKLGDEGMSLTLDGLGQESGGLTYGQIECFWSELKTPDSIIAEMTSTRALDGKQAGEWGNIHASWTYHPDNGLQMILTFSK